MKKDFNVTVRLDSWKMVRIEAENEDDAVELVLEGYGSTDREEIKVIDKEIISVEEIEND